MQSVRTAVVPVQWARRLDNVYWPVVLWSAAAGGAGGLVGWALAEPLVTPHSLYGSPLSWSQNSGNTRAFASGTTFVPFSGISGISNIKVAFSLVTGKHLDPGEHKKVSI